MKSIETNAPSDRLTPHIVVVGPCASGKSTLVDALTDVGYQASACGQEHSDIPTLWRHTDPDIVIALDVSLEELRHRRGLDWPEFLWRTQQRRLDDARSHATWCVDTSTMSPSQLVPLVIELLESR